jgi:hypothetical protein
LLWHPPDEAPPNRSSRCRFAGSGGPELALS